MTKTNPPRLFGVFTPIGHDVQLAQQGAAFLVVYAPSDAETNRVMNVSRRFNATLARKYHRLAIEHLLG